MARTYTLKRRAENQAETRRRIVEATVELHAKLGPAQTTVSAIADRAGVQRHTVYAHFPTDHELYLACSGLALERDPLPDEREWRLIADPEERLRRGLTEIYGWFARNADLAGSVLRDAEIHPPTRDIAHMRIGTRMQAYGEVLAEGFDATPELQAALGLALSFYTWRSLVRDAGLSNEAAAAVMTQAIRSASR